MSVHYLLSAISQAQPSDEILMQKLKIHLLIFSFLLMFEVQISIIRLFSPSNLEPFKKLVIIFKTNAITLLKLMGLLGS